MRVKDMFRSCIRMGDEYTGQQHFIKRAIARQSCAGSSGGQSPGALHSLDGEITSANPS